MMIQPGARVKVYHGHNGRPIGLGNYLGTTTVRRFHEGGQLVCDEVLPDDPDEVLEVEGELLSNHPAIQLDDGQIVFGCEVWWHEA